MAGQIDVHNTIHTFPQHAFKLVQCIQHMDDPEMHTGEASAIAPTAWERIPPPNHKVFDGESYQKLHTYPRPAA